MRQKSALENRNAKRSSMSKRAKKIAIVYTKDPLQPCVGMDMIRWHEISIAMAKRGFSVDMVTALDMPPKYIHENIRVVSTNEADWESYATIKSCYQRTIKYIPEHKFIISRLARVVSKEAVSRDALHADDLIECQKIIQKRSKVIIVNDEVNAKRWTDYHGNNQKIYIIPTGCHSQITGTEDAVNFGSKQAIFTGALSNNKIVDALNTIGKGLKRHGWNLKIIGSNKTKYYCSQKHSINTSLCSYLEPIPVEETWQHLQNASVGIAIAPGSHIFENETSKIYYYLRAGLPIVCEERIPNSDLILELNWGWVFKYEDYKDAVDKIICASELKNNDAKKRSVISHMIDKHSWDKRAEILDNIIDSNMLA